MDIEHGKRHGEDRGRQSVGRSYLWGWHDSVRDNASACGFSVSVAAF